MSVKIKSVALAALLFVVFVGRAQDQHLVDSLRRAYQATPEPERKIDLFYEIALEVGAGDPAAGFRYADSLDVLTEAVKGYARGRAMALHLRAAAYYDQADYEQALAFYRRELAIFNQIGTSENQSSALSNIGMVWSDLGRNDSAAIYYIRSIQLDEHDGRLFDASIIHNNLGGIYSDDGVYDKAIEHFEAALRIRQQLGVEKKYAMCYLQLANVYGRMKNMEKAEGYTHLGMTLAEKYGNRAQAAILCNNLGNTYSALNRPTEAIPWLQKARQYYEQLGNKAQLPYPIVNLSKAYHLAGDDGRALALAREGYALIEENRLDGLRELYYRAFAEAYEGLGQPAEAYRWYKKYVAEADSIFKQDNLRKVVKTEAQYESAKQKAEIAEQQLTIERQQNRQRLLLSGALALLLILLGFFQYFRNRQRLRQKETHLALALQEAEAGKLRELDRAKSAFFANISHEFRTPLTLILGPLQHWLEPDSDPENSTRATASVPTKDLLHIRRNAGRLLELVNQLLDLSKLESGRMRLQAARGDVMQTLRVLANAFESMADQSGIHYQILIAEESALGWFDGDKLEKIAGNLLANALKHTPPGGSVTFRASIRDERLLLAVEDTGQGIPANMLDKIFERFYQVEGSGEQGTGIGLALAKELVTLHYGQIMVESQVGAGSVFRIELPLAEGDFAVDERVASRRPAEAATGKIRFPPVIPAVGIAETAFPEDDQRPLCLVVEDNRDLQVFIREQLEGQFRVLLAANGREGLAAAVKTIPDLIVSDVMMPEMDGNQLCAALKTDERTSHVPVILLTARAGQESRLTGLETGADDYLTKPFDTRELLVRARNLVAQRVRLRRQFSRTVILKPQEIALTSVDERFLQRVQDTLNSRLGDEQFSVEALASAVGMSRSQLHRKLTALIDQPPVEFMRNFRLRRAKEMLESGAGNVSEICYEVGFGSPAYFSKAFKDAFGLSPSEVRKG